MDDFDLDAFDSNFDESALEASAVAAEQNIKAKERAEELELEELRKDSGECIGGCTI